MAVKETGKILYLDCSSGLSGDMFVGAMLDLGVDPQMLEQTLHTLPLDGYSIRISRVMKSALNVCDFDVILDGPENGLDHDMKYLYGHEQKAAHASSSEQEHAHEHEHMHEQEQEHAHEHAHMHEQEHAHIHEQEHAHENNHDYEHEHNYAHDHQHAHDHDHAHNHEPGYDHAHDHDHGHTHPHVHRNLQDITDILKGGALSAHALELALRVFTIVAQAEAHVHGKTIDEVHFHEVGAVDSIVDIAAAAICLDELKIDRVVLTHLTDGTGTVRCQHGILPIPVPAVAQIASAHALPMHIAPIRGELVTPTGAALAAAIRTDHHLPEQFEIRKIGMGAGKRDYETAGFLRAMLIEAC